MKVSNINNDNKRYLKLKEDLENNAMYDISLVYQPKIDLKNKDIISWEVLSRWNHNEFGFIPPLEFIKIIKDVGKEYEFDIYVFEEMCRHINKVNYKKNSYSMNIAINTLKNSNIHDDILRITSKYYIDPTTIILEIVETSDADEYDVISDTINNLEKMGYTISIDDFGTGYSSYYRLCSINFGEIKIPREFLCGSNINKDKQKKILKAMVNMGKNLGCKVVIEGIETLEDHNLAIDLGADYAQGYLYFYPMSFNEYSELITKH